MCIYGNLIHDREGYHRSVGTTEYCMNCSGVIGYPYMREKKIRSLPHTEINTGRWGKG